MGRANVLDTKREARVTAILPPEMKAQLFAELSLDRENFTEWVKTEIVKYLDRKRRERKGSK